MLKSTLDHLIVTAPSLATGRDQLATELGVALQAGGEHPGMGTHNALLRLGESSYLEVIAPDPAAPRPARARWFGLDSLPASAPARLRAWVVRTEDLDAALSGAPVDFAASLAMTRGDFAWRITMPAEGASQLAGVAPCLIQWSTAHPAPRLDDVGCSLVDLELRLPQPDALRALLAHLAFEGPVTVAASPPGEPASLRARLRTPGGLRVLEGTPA